MAGARVFHVDVDELEWLPGVDFPESVVPAKPDPGAVCPTCDRRVPVPHEHSAPRKRSQFNVAVPADEAEDGAQVIRALVDAAREKLVAGGSFSYDADCPPYYVLVAVLHDWLTSA